ncbi:unnamed protein product, partial [Brassica oleracea]
MANAEKTSSGSDIDEKKRKRKLSNRESARRSRLKKQKLMEDTIIEISTLERRIKENNERCKVARRRLDSLESENVALRSEKTWLLSYVSDLENMIATTSLTLTHSGGDDENVNVEIAAGDCRRRPWQEYSCVYHCPMLVWFGLDRLRSKINFAFTGCETPYMAGIINPGSEGFQKLFFGQEEIVIPVHAAIEAACAAHPTADVFINFASLLVSIYSAVASSMAALKQPTIKIVAIIAEGVPESDTKQLIAYARANNKVVIGPATVGGIQAGAFKIECLRVFFIHHSSFPADGMSNEMYNTVARVTDGIYEGIAIGGDVFPGSTLSDHIFRFNNIPQIKMMVVLGELGGRDEYSLVEALKQGKVNEHVVAWVSGTCARLFKSEVQFGRTGAKSGGEMESAQAKNQAPMDAGAIVPISFEALKSAIKETFEKLVFLWTLNHSLLYIHMPLSVHFLIIVNTNFAGEEPCYAGVPMSSIIEQGLGVGLLTIGPRFGGAIDDAARYFKDACDRVKYYIISPTATTIILFGRIKSRDNRDKRVELLQKFARSNFPSVKYMEYAVTMESYTLSKANNLVLNVDGAIRSLFLDLLAGSGMFTKQEIDEIVQISYLNGLFVLARSIGLIGHTFYQKRLKQPLYRHHGKMCCIP